MVLFFPPRTLIFLCYIDAARLATVTRRSGALDVSAAKLFEQMLGGTQAEGQDADSGRFVRAVEKDAGIASVQIRDIVSLAESVGDEFLRIVTHAAGARVVEAPTGNIR